MKQIRRLKEGFIIAMCVVLFLVVGGTLGLIMTAVTFILSPKVLADKIAIRRNSRRHRSVLVGKGVKQ